MPNSPILRRLTLILILVPFILRGAVSRAADDSQKYKDSGLPADQRVEDLLHRMTLAEKVQQLRCVWQIEPNITTNDQFDPAKAPRFFAEGIGEMGPIRWETGLEVRLRNDIQQYVATNTRLGIPVLFHDEGCHGELAPGATSFPIPIGIACSWDTELIERIYSVVAGEMRARGIGQALTPIVDICRDPRWGRTDETMGEDPFLNGTLGAAMVRGFQGSATGAIGPGHVAATLKHLTGHGQPEGGINRGASQAPLREILDAHLVPFRMAIALAHPSAVMPSYNEVDGVPSHANAWLLQDILRKQFGFQGVVVSDYEGVEYLSDVHGVGADHTEAALRAINAGVDMNMPKGDSYTNLPVLVATGRLSESVIDNAVRRVLRLKFNLGLFDEGPADVQKAIDITHLESSKTLALEAAQKSIVLLKNRAGILPLAKGKYKTIAVIGPNANEARLGSYSGEPWYKVTVLDGIRKKVGDTSNVVYAEGCKITANLPESSMAAWQSVAAVKLPTPAEDQTEIAQAVAIAKDADLIILVVGENETIARESWAANHVGDRDSMELFGAQNDLANAMFALGKPVVVYLMNGKPLAIPTIAEKADAIIEGWYMGQETGTAAADVLFGDVNPSGKLTITFPRATGNLPDYYDHKPGSRIYNFVEGTDKPLYPFGFGLSYTTFKYSQPVLSKAAIKVNGETQATVAVTNTGTVAGDEIVQLYLHQRVSSVTRPVEELKGFQRISLAPGETKSVTFIINRESLAFHDINMNYVVEPGAFDVMTGPSSASLQKTTLRIEP
jgi:beta-glucosidase